VCHRQVAPAAKSKVFREQALTVQGTTVLAHVRRATIGTPAPVNTHPFRDGDDFLIHNGHIEAFESIRPWLLSELSAEQEATIQGTTDSEHFFQLARAKRAAHPDATMLDAVRRACRQVAAWSEAVDPDAEVALNTLWSDGNCLAGSRLGRSLWMVERDDPFVCGACPTEHVTAPADDYRIVVFASERITDEDWVRVPSESAFMVTEDLDVAIEPLEL
jgi:glutamine amidotransferase